MNTYTISEEQLKLILSYLASKPYIEVFEGIKMLQSLDKIQKESFPAPKLAGEHNLNLDK